jgi:hypothetical protein
MSTNQVWEKYFDLTHNRPYYYNTATEETVWEEPKEAKIIDRTEPEPVVVKPEVSEIADYLAHQQKIDELQR